VKFVACARENATEVGDDEVDLLLEEGWRPEDVALLTTGTRHPEQKQRQAAGHAAYWGSFWDADQVFYGRVLGFKGLERRAVVLVVWGSRVHRRSRWSRFGSPLEYVGGPNSAQLSSANSPSSDGNGLMTQTVFDGCTDTRPI
jgi:hypothetical protein